MSGGGPELGWAASEDRFEVVWPVALESHFTAESSGYCHRFQKAIDKLGYFVRFKASREIVVLSSASVLTL